MIYKFKIDIDLLFREQFFPEKLKIVKWKYKESNLYLFCKSQIKKYKLKIKLISDEKLEIKFNIFKLIKIYLKK